MDADQFTLLITGNIRRLLTDRGWTQGQLADKLGWTSGNMSRLMTGRREPGAELIAKLVTALDCEPCDLVRLAAADAEPSADVRTPAKGKRKPKGK